MNVNLSNYNYSYANAIGSGLKQPLFKLVVNIAIASNGKPLESQARRIAKVAFHCLVATIFVIPAELAWLVGKSISYFSKTQIDHEGLFLAPPPIQIPKAPDQVVDIPDQVVDIRILATKFDQLNLPDTRSADQTSKKDSLARLCEWTANKDERLYPDEPPKRELFYEQLSVFLIGIINKIESGQVSKDKEKDILMELAEASTRCCPTWLEVSAKLFAEVNDQAETVQIKLMRLIQEHKESIILEFCQQEADAQWHALNYVRNILGRELGLNTVLNTYDSHAAQNDAVFGKGLVKWLFLQRYENINRLISSIQIMINSQKYDDSYHEFLLNEVRQQGIEEPENHVTNHFYNENYQLNEAGVNFMLRCIGIVK